MYVCMYIYICIRIYICMFVYMYTCIYVYMYICICVYEYTIYTYTHQIKTSVHIICISHTHTHFVSSISDTCVPVPSWQKSSVSESL